MPRSPVGSVLRFAVVLVVGCGADGPDLTGTYQVTAYTADPTGCANLVAVTDPPPYVRFEKDELLGHSYFGLHACTDPAQVDCPSAGLYGLFAAPIDDGWRAELGFAQTAGGCILDYTIADARLIDGALTIEGHHYHDETDRPESECTGEHAVEIGDALPCVSAEHLEANLTP